MATRQKQAEAIMAQVKAVGETMLKDVSEADPVYVAMASIGILATIGHETLDHNLRDAIIANMEETAAQLRELKISPETKH